MITTAQLAAFALAALVVTLAPGPDTFLVIGNTIAGGVRRGMATLLGIVSGGAFHIALFALGLAQILVYSPTAFLVVKTAGALYLVWLGIGALRSAWRGGSAPVDLATTPAGDTATRENRSLWSSYAQGVLTNALNPKVALFYLAFLPQFMQPGDDIAAKSALLIGLHYAMGLVWLSLVVLAVGRLGRWLSRGRVRRWLDGLVGTAMLMFGVKLALSR